MNTSRHLRQKMTVIDVDTDLIVQNPDSPLPNLDFSRTENDDHGLNFSQVTQAVVNHASSREFHFFTRTRISPVHPATTVSRFIILLISNPG